MGDRLATINMGRKVGGYTVPIYVGREELGPRLTQCGLGRGLHTKRRLDPSNRLATVHQRYRQADRQRSDSIGRTVLQTVAQTLLSGHRDGQSGTIAIVTIAAPVGDYSEE